MDTKLEERTPKEVKFIGWIIVVVFLLILSCVMIGFWKFFSPILYVLWVGFLLLLLFIQKEHYTKEERKNSWRSHRYAMHKLWSKAKIYSSSIKELQEYAREVLELNFAVGLDDLHQAVSRTEDETPFGIVPTVYEQEFITWATNKYQVEFAQDEQDLRNQIVNATEEKFDEKIKNEGVGVLILGLVFLIAPIFTAFNATYQVFPLNFMGLFALIYGFFVLMINLRKYKTMVDNMDDKDKGPRNPNIISRLFRSTTYILYVIYFVGVLLVKVGIFHGFPVPDLLNLLA